MAFFGSVLRDDFQPGSDVDVLVEFEPATRMGMIRLAGLELELGKILGSKVDLNVLWDTIEDELSPLLATLETALGEIDPGEES